MLSQEIYHLVFIEQHKDRIREIEQLLLLKTAEPQGAGLTFHRQAIGRLGTQMVKWGAKLQEYDSRPTSKQLIMNNE